MELSLILEMVRREKETAFGRFDDVLIQILLA